MLNLEIVIDRDPDAMTGVHLFYNGEELRTHPDISITIIDPGSSGADDEWQESMRSQAEDLSLAAAELVRELAERYAGRY